jgi:hypothetical protein
MPLGMARRDPRAVTSPGARVAARPWPVAQAARHGEVRAWWWGRGRTKVMGWHGSEEMGLARWCSIAMRRVVAGGDSG